MGPPLWIHLWLLPVLVSDLVAIESSPSDEQLSRIAIASCSATLGVGQCRSAAEPGGEPSWLVRVSWQGSDRLRARIEIRRAGEAAPASVRVVEFSAADDSAQRHRAMGLIIAAYVIEQAESARPPPERAPPALPPPREPEAQPVDRAERQDEEREEEESEAEAKAGDVAIAWAEDDHEGPQPPPRLPSWCADLALLAGPGLDRGSPRLGLLLRGLVRPFDLPLSGLLELRAARRVGEPALLWLGGGAGLALRLQTPLRPLAFELRGEFALERVQAEAQDEPRDREESGAAMRYWGRLGLEAHLSLGGRLGLVAGAELSALDPVVYLDIGGRTVGQDSVIGWGGLIGVRLTD